MPMPAMTGHLRRLRKSTDVNAPNNTPLPVKLQNVSMQTVSNLNSALLFTPALCLSRLRPY